jgi:hypothetical protein
MRSHGRRLRTPACFNVCRTVSASQPNRSASRCSDQPFPYSCTASAICSSVRPCRRSSTPDRRRCPATVVRWTCQRTASSRMFAPAWYSVISLATWSAASRRCIGRAGAANGGSGTSARSGRAFAKPLSCARSFELPPVRTTTTFEKDDVRNKAHHVGAPCFVLGNIYAQWVGNMSYA